MKRYGKPNLDVIEAKSGFVVRNEEWKLDQSRIDQIFRDQPARTTCKNCELPVGSPVFTKEGIDYFVCERCGHLSGGHLETEEFCRMAYAGDGESRYAKKYHSEDVEAFRSRTATIYEPKAEFLLSALAECGEAAEQLRYADLGAGSGYMISALVSKGAKNAIGYEASSAQVMFGNEMLQQDLLVDHDLNEVDHLAATVEADVITMIGTLEHFREPRAVLKGLSENPSLSYVFFSVPLFSATVFFDLMFQAAHQAQLGGRHTHLYTESSIQWFCDEFGFERVAEWWFGSDMMHLLRHLAVEASRQGQPQSATEHCNKRFIAALDDMQRALDEKCLSSEVHMLVRRRPQAD